MTETGSTPQSRSTEGDPTTPSSTGSTTPPLRRAPPPSPRTTRVAKPDKPIMGDIIEVRTDEWIAWTIGGKPKADWSGPEDPNVTPEPKWYRSATMSAAKSQHYRTEGLTIKCAYDGSNLTTFQRRFYEKMYQHGMGTVAWLPSPADPSKMMNIIDQHGWFHDISANTKLANQIAEDKFDKYLVANSKDAISLLYNSIDDDLEQQLYESSEPEDCFAAHWLNLMYIIRSVSAEQYNKLKAKLKERRVSDYSAEDIKAMATHYLDDYKRLDGAGMYEHSLTLNMLEAMSEANEGDEDWKSPLRKLSNKLDKALLDIRHLDYASAHRHMVKEELDVKSVLKKVKATYRKLLDGGKWKPANHAKDSKALNRNYGRVNKVEASPKAFDTKAYINQLVQSALNKHSDKSAKPRGDKSQESRRSNPKSNSRRPTRLCS